MVWTADLGHVGVPSPEHDFEEIMHAAGPVGAEGRVLVPGPRGYWRGLNNDQYDGSIFLTCHSSM